ncbi:MAG: alpha/beta hydrolase-fold protein [Candidatus Didemnitutus sp.]|nr:alpha/beta hydrolase-fold protein [Candidatus Didemnitutus sp.]
MSTQPGSSLLSAAFAPNFHRWCISRFLLGLLILPFLSCDSSGSSQTASPPALSANLNFGLATGTLQSVTFHSATLRRSFDYLVFLPAGYQASSTKRYPVLFLLHGRGDSMQAWATIKLDLDRLIATGKIPPVIAVMPDAPGSHRAGYYIDSQFTGTGGGTGLPAGELLETAFTRDLMAHVDAAFPTRTDRASRLVAGYSMGGAGALRHALAHPELFGAAIVLSPAVYFPLPPRDSSTREFGAFGLGRESFSEQVYRSLNYPALLPEFASKGLPLAVFIAVGDDETALTDPAEASHDLDYEAHTLYNHLRRTKGVSAQLRVVDGGHNWGTWRPAFSEGVTFAFEWLKSEVPTPK